MNKNQYKQKTKLFGIPVPGWNDGIWPELELMKWQMVENMLVAAMRGNVNSVFDEGDFRIRQQKDGTYSAVLSATGQKPSVRGTVGGAYFNAPSVVVWDKLEVGQSYFLYLKGSSKTFQDASSVVPVSSPRRLPTNYVVLIGKADLTGSEMAIDRYPSGKVNSRDLAQHVLDFENPHGEKMVQDEILIRKRLAIGDGNDAEIEIDVNGEVVHIPASRIVNGLRTNRVIVDFLSGGSEGVILKGNGKVVFANVIRIDRTDHTVGEVSIGFYGIDTKVKSSDEVIVFNRGDVNVAMRAMIVCE